MPTETAQPTAIKPLTLQEVFDTIWQRFVVEGAPRAFNEVQQSCQYRMPDGGRCFIGAVIPDELYEPVFEHTGGIISVLYEHQELKELLPFDIEVLARLQSIHDMYDVGEHPDVPFQEHCRDGLTAFASDNHLTIPFG